MLLYFSSCFGRFKSGVIYPFPQKKKEKTKYRLFFFRESQTADFTSDSSIKVVVDKSQFAVLVYRPALDPEWTGESRTYVL